MTAARALLANDAHREHTMVLFTWHTTDVPADMRVTQVYGFIFATDGRVILHTDTDKVSLPGGTPQGAETRAETLLREVMEEVTCTITDPIYLGYQQVDEQDGTAPYAQVRMIARLAEVLPATPDPATGLIARRTLIHPAEAASRLGWGDLGYQQLADATSLAAKQWGIPDAPIVAPQDL